MASKSIYGEIIILNPFIDVIDEDLKSHKLKIFATKKNTSYVCFLQFLHV
jgi:hypothetical protein